eukprot:11939250-Alexandrium_andersonii.AAC.1
MGVQNLHQDAGDVFPRHDVLDRASRGFSPFWPYACLRDGVFEPMDRFELPDASMFDRDSARKRATGVVETLQEIWV